MTPKQHLILDKELFSYIQAHDTSLSTNALALYEASAALPLAQRLSTLDTATLLALLVRLHQPQSLLEIGTFTGFATLVLAEAMPNTASIITIDTDARWYEVAFEHWRTAGVHERIQQIHSDARVYLETLAPNTQFDFIFIDADKGSYDFYFEKAWQHLSDTGVIVIDNTLWRGEVARAATTDKIVHTLRTLNDDLRQREDLIVTILPIGDGVTIVTKR